jgi:hypothetical protein
MEHTTDGDLLAGESVRADESSGLQHKKKLQAYLDDLHN